MNNSIEQIRKKFLNFFQKNGHTILESSSLIPKNDSSLLFTNAGMNQFKNIFLGYNKSLYPRIATAQRCIRVGGKHNDLENVGYTTRHHTFFEMLGNFSFGDYFKKEAIQLAWELLTHKDFFNLSPNKFWITVYQNDNETYNIWLKDIGIPKERIIFIGDKNNNKYVSDNFWQMSETGPCGPCTEIFYDHGDHLFGSIPGTKETSGARYVEIWNIVFIQFNREKNGTMIPLPYPLIDTGMGLERISAVLQKVHSNYEIDLFKNLILYIAEITETKDITNNKSLHVIADHIRACVFLIADGTLPSNEKRGYVLRRLIRRAVRHGNLLGIKNTFLWKLVQPVIGLMSFIKINLKNYQNKIEEVLKIEEKQFLKTLKRGLFLLENEIKNLKSNVLDGATVFRLYDTFGFPIDLTTEICHERNLIVDMKTCHNLIEKQKKIARKSSFFILNAEKKNTDNEIEFSFFEHKKLDMHKTEVKSIYFLNKKVNELKAGQSGIIILNSTPFYFESGGQIGDVGILINDNFEFYVEDTKKHLNTIMHLGNLKKGTIRVGDQLCATVNKDHRLSVSINHSATHLLHSALRNFFGKSIVQKGSVVKDKCFRFDFSYHNQIKHKELFIIEDIVNDYIRNNIKIETSFMDINKAKNLGAIALFEEKYNNTVRVVNIRDISIELCGGTHAKRTGDIGTFLILSTSKISSNVCRIEAVTGKQALFSIHSNFKKIIEIKKVLQTNDRDLEKKVSDLLQYTKSLEEKVYQNNKKEAIKNSEYLLKKIVNIKNKNFLFSQVHNIDKNIFQIIINFLKTRLVSGIILLANVSEKNVLFISYITKDLTNHIKSNDIIKQITSETNGKGGGKSDFAQGITKDLIKFQNIWKKIKYRITEIINNI
ncbi:alanine--tRNA ligase [Candidatus Tachikawaea gelatinosa]|uniref:Alanine--tRNA ligase n=1 Tax=Candidatus Tachikawaea gelatinosa TaxID=1410383 RepID=A0A090AK87_9ENTR|nr:alanine--tRNA ligase [Candidatus Tachikawaea gelatinosa]BAP58848.1 alanine--tRNA ligase [Candidatus Tachikawaea gelatinosa]